MELHNSWIQGNKILAKSCIQGSKKIPSSSLGQVDFVAVAKLTCTMGKGPSKSFPN